MVADMEVDRVADMAAEKKLAKMEMDMVADMEVDKLVDMVQCAQVARLLNTSARV